MIDGSSQILGTGIFFVDSFGKVNKKGTLKTSEGRELGDMFVDGKLIENGVKSRIKPLYDFVGSSPIDSRNRSRISGSSLFRSSLDMKPSIVNSNNKIIFTK